MNSSGLHKHTWKVMWGGQGGKFLNLKEPPRPGILWFSGMFHLELGSCPEAIKSSPGGGSELCSSRSRAQHHLFLHKGHWASSPRIRLKVGEGENKYPLVAQVLGNGESQEQSESFGRVISKASGTASLPLWQTSLHFLVSAWGWADLYRRHKELCNPWKCLKDLITNSSPYLGPRKWSQIFCTDVV